MTTEVAIDLSNEETIVWLLSFQLKKLRWHNGSAIDLSNANPARGQRGTKVNNGSHHGDNPLLKSTAAFNVVR